MNAATYVIWGLVCIYSIYALRYFAPHKSIAPHDITREWHDAFKCTTSLIHMRHITHPYTWHDSFKYTTWHVSRDSSMCVTSDIWMLQRMEFEGLHVYIWGSPNTRRNAAMCINMMYMQLMDWCRTYECCNVYECESVYVYIWVSHVTQVNAAMCTNVRACMYISGWVMSHVWMLQCVWICERVCVYFKESCHTSVTHECEHCNVYKFDAYVHEGVMQHVWLLQCVWIWKLVCTYMREFCHAYECCNVHELMLMYMRGWCHTYECCKMYKYEGLYVDVWVNRATRMNAAMCIVHTRWRRPIGCLKLQVIFRKRATDYRALLRKMT